MPTRVAAGGMRVPDLHQIDESAWPQVLADLPAAHRLESAFNPNLGERAKRAYALAVSMPPSATDLARATLDEPARVPVPRVDPRPELRQVNIRVRRSEYEDLATAARLLGARPAQLARMFVLNGTRRALADQDAVR